MGPRGVVCCRVGSGQRRRSSITSVLWRSLRPATVFAEAIRQRASARSTLVGPSFGTARSRSRNVAVRVYAGGSLSTQASCVLPAASSRFSRARATRTAFAFSSAPIRCAAERLDTAGSRFSACTGLGSARDAVAERGGRHSLRDHGARRDLGRVRQRRLEVVVAHPGGGETRRLMGLLRVVEQADRCEYTLAVKGANIGVASSWGEGWEDRRHGLLVSLPCGAGSARRAYA